MQQILQKFEDALSEQDLLQAPRQVDELLRLYLTKNTSLELRAEIISLVERKANESSNAVLRNYLRTVADCIRNSPLARGTELARGADWSQEIAPQREPRTARAATPHRNALGDFLKKNRPLTPEP